MPTSYTTNLRLSLPATGELSGTWGNEVNNSITQMVEQALTGIATVNTWVGAAATLTTSNGATDQSRCAVLQLSGAPGAAATVNVPAVSKLYIVKNSVTGGYAATVKTAAGSGVSVPNGATTWVYCDGTNVVDGMNYAASLVLGSPLAVLYGGTGTTTSTGTGSVVLSASPTFTGTVTIPTLSLTNALPATSGGTGQTGYTTGDLLVATTGTTVGKLSDVATGSVLISGGVGVAPAYGKVGLTTHVVGTLPVTNGGTGVTSSTGTGNVVLSASPTFTGTVLMNALNLTTPLGVSYGGTGVTTSTGTTNLVLSDSPALTGTPTAPTASAATNTTQLATTAFVQTAVSALPSGTLPSLTGNAGKFLTNDGVSTVSWAGANATGSTLYLALNYGGL